MPLELERTPGVRHCSHDTAKHDHASAWPQIAIRMGSGDFFQDLIGKGVLVMDPDGGPGSSYSVLGDGV